MPLTPHDKVLRTVITLALGALGGALFKMAGV